MQVCGLSRSPETCFGLSPAMERQTIITGGTNLYQNGAQIELSAANQSRIHDAVIENLQISKFEYGIRVTYGESIQIRNGCSGEYLSGFCLSGLITAAFRTVNGSTEARTMDLGYGLSIV